MRLRRSLAIALPLALAAVAVPAGAEPPSCAAGTLASVTIGEVASAACVSEALGGVTPFSYYVPAECTPASRCPVLYLLHGFGGSHTGMLGTASSPSAFVRALARDPVTGVDLPDLSFILVGPHGRTVPTLRPGAPPPDQESFWVDWNPRYWQSPPRFEEFVAGELLGLVDRSLPSIATREGRAVLGVSLGGFGSFSLAFQHPDRYASAGSVSGALNVLVAPAPQPVGPGRPGLGGSPERLPYRPLPRVVTTPPGFPFGDPFGAFGDPAADEASYRGNNPLDLALNASGLHLRFFTNDAVPRSPSDFADPRSYAGAQALEAIVLPMNLEMRAALVQHGHPNDFEVHEGLHAGSYWDPHIRRQLEEQYARVSRPGAPLPPSAPESFDFRSISKEFGVWGWNVAVEREPVEFVTLWDVSRDGLTITGSGRVRITLPPLGATGAAVDSGRPFSSIEFDADGFVRSIEVDLGPSGPTDEHAGASGVPGAGRTARISLSYDA